MNRGEFLTRITIWIALGGYALSVAITLLGRESRMRKRDFLVWQARARWIWTIGCAALFAHTICALHFYHAWSQVSAYRETARQTAEVTGLDWGGGLLINYAFLAAWIADVFWWWRGLEAYRRRHRLITAFWHGFFIFMIFNATVVFETGLVRAIGAGLCLLLLALWLWSFRNGRLAASR
ncbi:MAG: hypothetical protein L0229_06920 [Blastocatellia bacterium]|nr:hypothetical protein [Blastocatellia bacterium]